jgi:carbon starvation protein
MALYWIVLAAALILALAYWTYGALLEKLFRVDSIGQLPAVALRDEVDFLPVPAATLFPQHFSAIAAAGPIVGPILAGVQFGWIPTLIWIVAGAILIGGVHDFASLVASVHHKARSIAEIVRLHMSPLSWLLFLIFIWISLVYIIVAFTDITAGSFTGPATEENGGVSGAAIASSSVMYLLLTLVMGCLLRFTKLPAVPVTLAFVVFVAISIGCGRLLPIDIQSWLGFEESAGGLVGTRKVWDVLILVYCLVAGVLPVWLLLQPRGQLGGYFLYAALGASALGIAIGGIEIEYPGFRGFGPVDQTGATLFLFPMLFITVACGACSGFHSLIASGTTSKQLACPADARKIGYGAMLLEGLVAVTSLCCVMMFAEGSAQLANKSPNQIYAAGIGQFMSTLGVNKTYAIAFALMAFTTFIYDTLDVCTRLGRYIIQELTGIRGNIGRWLGTIMTAGVPLYLLLRHPEDSKQAVWREYWTMFGASNQLLAALTLLAVTAWIWRTRRAWWVWPVVALPMVWMYTMSNWALASMTFPRFSRDGKFAWPTDPVTYAGAFLLLLAAVMLIEAIRMAIWGKRFVPASET